MLLSMVKKNYFFHCLDVDRTIIIYLKATASTKKMDLLFVQSFVLSYRVNLCFGYILFNYIMNLESVA